MPQAVKGDRVVARELGQAFQFPLQVAYRHEPFPTAGKYQRRRVGRRLTVLGLAGPMLTQHVDSLVIKVDGAVGMAGFRFEVSINALGAGFDRRLDDG